MRTIWQDVRYGLRMLLKGRLITLVVVLTLGLSIGMNTTIFSVINSFLLRPLPVEHPRQLMVLANSHPGGEAPHGLSYLDLLDFKGADAFAGMSGFTVGFVASSDQNYAERIAVSYVTPTYFEMLGIKPFIGRLPLPTEGRIPGADSIAVLGYRYWQHRFGGSPDVIGRRLRINARPFIVIGVVPREFRGTYSMLDMDAYLPMSMIGIESGSGADTLTKRNNHRLTVLARLKPSVDVSEARAQLQVIASQLEKQYPDTDKGLKMSVFPEMIARPQPANAVSNPPVAAIFLMLVAFLMLIACVNVANILLVQFTSRHKELATRAAFGASRTRIMFQLLIEALLMSVLAAAFGLLVGEFGAKTLAAVRLPVDLPIVFDFSLDWRVFTYVASIALLTAILIGIMPAFRSSRRQADSLREYRVTPGRHHHRMRNALVAAQVAGAVILVTSAGLFVRSLRSLRRVDLGFHSDHLLNVVMDPGQIGYDRVHAETFYSELKRRAHSLPGIESVSLAMGPPMSDYNATAWVTYQGQVLPPNDKGLPTAYNMVSPEYFKTMGIQLLAGRPFAEADSAKSTPVAIINERLSEKLWPNENPLGKQFTYNGPQGPFVEVIGLTPTGKYGMLSEAPQPFFYVPISQQYSSFRVLQARTTVPPGQMAKPLVGLIQGLEPDLAVSDVHTMEELLEGENGFFPYRIAAWVAGAVGLLALVLGTLGVYGVVSFTTTQRTHEIGVRLALGARPRDIVRLVLSDGLRIVLVGVALGIGAMLVVSRLLRNLLFGIGPDDPMVYAFVIAVLSVVAIAACFLPAYRTTRIQPMGALRYE